MFRLNALVVIELLEFAFMMVGEFSENMSHQYQPRSWLGMKLCTSGSHRNDIYFAYISTYRLFLSLSASHLSHVCSLVECCPLDTGPRDAPQEKGDLSETGTTSPVFSDVCLSGNRQ